MQTGRRSIKCQSERVSGAGDAEGRKVQVWGRHPRPSGPRRAAHLLPYLSASVSPGFSLRCSPAGAEGVPRLLSQVQGARQRRLLLGQVPEQGEKSGCAGRPLPDVPAADCCSEAIRRAPLPIVPEPARSGHRASCPCPGHGEPARAARASSSPSANGNGTARGDAVIGWRPAGSVPQQARLGVSWHPIRTLRLPWK